MPIAHDAVKRAQRLPSRLLEGTIARPPTTSKGWLRVKIDGQRHVQVCPWEPRLDLDPLPGDAAVVMESNEGNYWCVAWWPQSGQVSVPPGGGGIATPATVTALGVVKLSHAPADPANPVAVETADARMTNARTPTAHTHPESDVTGLVTDLGLRVQIGGDLGGTPTAPTVPALTGKEDKANKGVANGYAPLDSGLLVPAANVRTLDAIRAPAADVSLASHKLINVADPTSAQDAATKHYADTPPVPLETVLAADFGPMTSPAATKLLSGSFVADFSTVEVTINVLGSVYENKVAYAGLVFFYGTPAQPVWPDNQAADRAGVARVNLGTISENASGFHRRITLTGLTPGTTYNWALATGITGYQTTVTLPEACNFVTASKAKGAAGALLDDFFDRIVVVSSANFMHVIRSNHLSRVKDEIVAASVPFSAGHGTGIAAVSPDGTRVLVSNASTNNASLFDLTDPAQPILIADFAVGLTLPVGVVWAPDGSAAYMADFSQTPGHVVKITGLLGASPAPVASAPVALGTVGASPNRLRITPDGTKLLVGDGTTEFYVVNTTATPMTVAKVTVPGASSSAGIDAINNTTAIVSYGSGTYALMDLTALTFSATFTDSSGLNGLLKAFGDGLTSIALRSAAGTNAVGHINHPVNSGDANLNMYTHWPTGGTPKDHWIDDSGNIYVVQQTPNNLAIWYGAQFNVRPSGAGISVAEHASVQFRGGH